MTEDAIGGLQLLARLITSSPTPVALVLMFAVGAVVETVFPRRPRRRDWLNWAYAPLFLVADMGLAIGAYQGLVALRRWLGADHLLPFRLGGDGFLEQIAGIAIFIFVVDGLIYSMHRLQHANRTLWRGHRVHHSDASVDVTTTVRIHVFDLAMKAVFLGAPFALVMPPPDLPTPGLMLVPFLWLYYIHLNIDVSHGRLWWLSASPNYHLLHHDADAEAPGCNFAAFLPVWDIAFGTARRDRDVAAVRIGLNDWEPRTLGEMIATPFAEASAIRSRRSASERKRR